MTSVSRLAQLRARLELPVIKQATGLLDGRHRSVFTGHGQDFDDLVDYRPGDDPGDIDWKTSARAGHPVIKRFQRETNLSMVLAVDTGRSMSTLAPSGETKKDVAIAVAELFAYLARGRGDLVGLISGDAERVLQLPPRQGTEHLESLLRRLDRDMVIDAPPSDLRRVIQRALTSLTRRSLVVIVTDEARPGPESENDLRKLRTRHEVMVVAIADLKPTELTGHDGVVVDIDGGVVPEFVRNDPVIREEARRVVEYRKRGVKDMLQRRGILSVVVEGSDDAINALIDLLGRQRRARR